MIWGMQKSADKPSVFSSLRTERNSEHRQALAREIRQCSLNNFNVGVLVCCISRTNYKQNQEPQGRLSGSFSRFQSTPLGSWHCRLLEGLKAAGKTMAPPPPPPRKSERSSRKLQVKLIFTSLPWPRRPCQGADGTDPLRKSKRLSLSDALHVGISATPEGTLVAMMGCTIPSFPCGHGAARMLGSHDSQRWTHLSALQVVSRKYDVSIDIIKIKETSRNAEESELQGHGLSLSTFPSHARVCTVRTAYGKARRPGALQWPQLPSCGSLRGKVYTALA